MVRGFDLRHRLTSACEHHDTVIHAVIGDAVAFDLHALYKFGIKAGVIAEHEESRGNALFFQHIQDLAGERRPGAVVECERHTVPAGAAAVEDPAGQRKIWHQEGICLLYTSPSP